MFNFWVGYLKTIYNFDEPAKWGTLRSGADLKALTSHDLPMLVCMLALVHLKKEEEMTFGNWPIAS